MRKNWLIIVFTVATGILIYLLFQLNRLKNFDHNDSSLKAIPSSAAVIIKARSVEYLKEQIHEEINFKPELYTSDLIKNALNVFTFIDSINVEEDYSLKDIENHPLYISFHGQGKQSVKTLYLLELRNKKEAIKIENFIESVLSSQYGIDKRKYNSTNIFEIKNPSSSKSYFTCINDGLVFISESGLLIETGLRQIGSSEDWTQTEAFQNVKKTAGAGSNINVFINFSTLQNVLLPITDKQVHNDLNRIDKQSEWGELDLEIKNDGLLLNGFLNGKTNGIYTYLLKRTKANKKEVLEFLSSNTKAYITLAVEDGKDLQNRLLNYYQNQNKSMPLSSVEKNHQIKIHDPIFSILSGEVALAFDGNNPSGILVLGLNSQSKAEGTFVKLLENMGNSSQPSRIYTPDDGLNYSIYKGFNEPVFKMIFSSFLGEVPNNYFTFYKNNLIVADSYKQLEQFIYNNILNRTLKYNKAHQSFLDNFSSRDNLFVFGRTEYLPLTTEKFFSPLWDNLKATQKKALSNFYAIGFQFSGTSDMVYSTTFLQHLPNKISEPQTVWQSLLDTLAITKPSLVKNHYSNEKEVIIQDAANNLYLMSSNGRMLWKRPLDAPILSDIVQIDYYKNNKLQYAFNTRNKIYILDRNGNHVANFPIRLPSPATNGLAVLDYDNNKDYRFFIACQNNKVYLYNKKGNIVPGWKFKGCEGLVSLPVQHFRNINKDYLVVSDDQKNYILDRQGNIRVQIKNDFVRNDKSPFYISDMNSNNAQLITSDANGQIKKINLQTGAVSSFELEKINMQHKLTVFTERGNERYVISEPNKVTVFNANHKKLFDKEFEAEINLNVDLYQFSSQNIKFGVSELRGNKIYLLNEDGSLYKGFPLLGKSRFSIGFLKSSSVKFNLIVAGANNYLYNYRVE